MAFRVFVSYSTRDLSVAESLQANLKSAGAEVFLAEYSAIPGQSLPVVILKAIEECDLFLLLWSTSAEGSLWVPQEIGVAQAKRKPIMPVVLHPGIQLTGFIQDLKYLAWYQDPAAAVVWLSNFVSEQRARKSNREAVALLAVSAAILFALGGSE
jgi:hypothetical protein